MADRRMMSKKIIDSDAFTEMPLSSQALYFHLLLRADDDGFLNNAKKIMRNIGANQNDYDMLIMKRFIIQFDEGVCVIKHWLIHNYIRSDRYKPTQYIEEKNMLSVKENGAYQLFKNDEGTPVGNHMETIGIPSENHMETIGIPNGNQKRTTCDTIDTASPTWETQVRLGKDRIGKDIIVSDDTICRTDVQRVVEAWNQLGINPVSRMASTSTRYKMISARIKEYGVDDVLKAIEKINESTFLKGGGSRGWMIDFEWFSRPNNFPKVLEGQYDDKKSSSNSWEGWLNE